MRAHIIIFTLLVFVCTSPAVGEGYRLDTGDTLRLHVSEWPDMTGEFAIDADGQISLPRAGRIDARGITLIEVTTRIKAAFEAQMQTQTPLNLTVDMASFRSFYVLGTEKAGAYEYRPGLSVLQAVALAGGPLRPVDMTDNWIGRETINARGDMLLAGRQRSVLKVRLARLETELAGSDKFTLPKVLDAQDSVVAAAFKTEQSTIESRNKTLSSATAHQIEMIKLFEHELQSIQAQIESRDDQIDVIEGDFERTQSLLERGLTTSQRETGIRQELAIAITLRRDLDTRIVQVRQNITEAKHAVTELIDTATQDTIQELQEAQSELLIADAMFVTAMQLLSEAQSIEAGVRSDAGSGNSGLRYYVQRNSPGGTQDIDALETTIVQPGDVVIVERSFVR